jgi:hypothetical protein
MTVTGTAITLQVKDHDEVLEPYRHYNGQRPPSQPRTPSAPARPPVANLAQERIKRRPVLGGLINEYERAA